MNKKITNFFSGIILVIVFGFILIVSVKVFSQIFINPTVDITKESIGAFLGAFLAFLFMRIADTIKRISDRQLKNYDSLVGLERFLNENLSTANNIIFIAEDMIKTAKDSIRENVILMNSNDFENFDIRESFSSNLLNIDLINKIFSLKNHLSKINNSIRPNFQLYSEIRYDLKNKIIDQDTYFMNLHIYAQSLEKLIVFIKESIEEIKDILAIIRVALRKERPFLTSMIQPILIKKYNDSDEQFKAERLKIESEIGEISRVSKQRIEKINER